MQGVKRFENHDHLRDETGNHSLKSHHKKA